MRKEAGGEDDKNVVSEGVGRAEKIGVGVVAAEAKFTRQRASTADENCTFETQPLFATCAPGGQQAEFIIAPS